MTIICALLTAYLVVLIVRAVLSWFSIRGDSPFAVVYRVLIDITEPLLAPLRRVIPPAGMFDLSFLVLFIIITILRAVLCSGGTFGF